MKRKVGGNLLQEQFGEINVYQELNQAQQTIEVLRSQIEQFKRSGNKEAEEEKLIELRNSLKEQIIVKIPVSQIEPNPEQPRKTFSHQKIMLLARSLEQDGQREPIFLFQVGLERYFLFDGERRWRASKLISKEYIDAIILPKPLSFSIEQPETLRRQALLTSHHRENLNPLDLAEALIEEISLTQNLKQEEILKHLDAAITRLTRKKIVSHLTELVALSTKEQEAQLNNLLENNLIKEDEKKIFQFLLSLQLNPASIKANIFPSLKLFGDLKDAIRYQGLGGHQGKVLQQLSPKKLDVNEKEARKIRQQLTKMVVEQKLSVAQTRKQVKDRLSQTNTQQQSSLIKGSKNSIEHIKKLNLETMETNELKLLETILQEKLKEVRMNLQTK